MLHLIRSKPFKSTVRDLLNFRFVNSPSWRKGMDKEDILTTEEMIEEIISLQKLWNTLKTRLPAHRIENIKKNFKIRYCNVNTDPLEESGIKQKMQETQNIEKLLGYLSKILEQETKEYGDCVSSSQLDCCGLIEKSMVQEGHKIAVCGKEVKERNTKPGEFSTNTRCTTHYSFEGVYYYREPEDMVDEVDIILDRFNSLLLDSCHKSNEKDKIMGIFKSLAWFLFEILDLHPFGNGNGRIFRVIVHYVLFCCGQTVVPCPIYNLCSNTQKNNHSSCSKPCKDTYERSLINARNSAKRHPEELATILVESVWKTWNEFMHDINNTVHTFIPEK